MLNNRNIVINVNTRLCTSCDTNNCLHFEAFYECSKNNCLLVCEPNILDKVTYYTPNPHNIFLIEDKIIHNFYISSGICICSSCHSKCKKQSILQLILEKIGYSASIGNPKDIDYETITTLKIPLILDDKLVSTYNNQLCEGINLPLHIFPESKFCSYGYKYHDEDKLKLQNTGIIIYTENDIIELDEHKGT